MRNKEAARRSRDRRKATMTELEGINARLQEQLERASKRLRLMRHEINDLSECNSELRRAAAARESATFLALAEAVGSREKANALVEDMQGDGMVVGHSAAVRAVGGREGKRLVQAGSLQAHSGCFLCHVQLILLLTGIAVTLRPPPALRSLDRCQS